MGAVQPLHKQVAESQPQCCHFFRGWCGCLAVCQHVSSERAELLAASLTELGFCLQLQQQSLEGHWVPSVRSTWSSQCKIMNCSQSQGLPAQDLLRNSKSIFYYGCRKGLSSPNPYLRNDRKLMTCREGRVNFL